MDPAKSRQICTTSYPVRAIKYQKTQKLVGGVAQLLKHPQFERKKPVLGRFGNTRNEDSMFRQPLGKFCNIFFQSASLKNI